MPELKCIIGASRVLGTTERLAEYTLSIEALFAGNNGSVSQNEMLEVPILFSDDGLTVRGKIQDAAIAKAQSMGYTLAKSDILLDDITRDIL